MDYCSFLSNYFRLYQNTTELYGDLINSNTIFYHIVSFIFLLPIFDYYCYYMIYVNIIQFKLSTYTHIPYITSRELKKAILKEKDSDPIN
jgi:hypothetical protein